LWFAIFFLFLQANINGQALQGVAAGCFADFPAQPKLQAASDLQSLCAWQ
jgi:hypothetical protein